MSITVVDQSPELFWFIRGLFQNDEVPIRHTKTTAVAKLNILQEFPKIVIINADDNAINCERFIKEMTDCPFFGDTKFIVVTGDSKNESTEKLLIAGASQVLFRTKEDPLSPEYSEQIIRWFLNSADPSAKIFKPKMVPFTVEAELTSNGRMNWISPSHCLIESDVDLNLGHTISVKNLLFKELEIKNVKLQCIEKNKIGRHYNYSFSYLCIIKSKELLKVQNVIKQWIEHNYNLSKYKSIKILFFENDFSLQEDLQKIITEGEHYVARGYKDLENFKEVLDNEIPHLVFIKRELIQKDRDKFESIRTFLRNNFCYCVTYSDNNMTDIEEFKKNYEFALHIPRIVDSQFLKSMVLMLENKLPTHLIKDNDKFYINKKSIYSKFSLHDTCKIQEIDVTGASVELPFQINNFGICEISAHDFFMADMNRHQYFRIFNYKTVNDIRRYRIIFLGQTLKARKALRENLIALEKVGHERWLKGER